MNDFLKWSKEKSDDVGYVYFVNIDGFVKIGRTNNPKRRMKEHKADQNKVIMIFKIKKYKSFERYCHLWFRKYRRHGEYFRIPQRELIDFYEVFEKYSVNIEREFY